MERDQIAEKMRQIIVDQLGVEGGDVLPAKSIVDDLGADSLDVVELVMAMEEEFGIEIPDEDAERIMTLNDAVEYVENRV